MSDNSIKNMAFTSPENLLQEGYTIATYFMEIEQGEEITEKAAAVAVGQSIGTWTAVPGITDEMLHGHLARVVGIFSVPPAEIRSDVSGDSRHFIVQIGFKEENFGAQFPMLLTTLLGNDVSTSAHLKLLDVQISPQLARDFTGPRFGIAGLRRLTGVRTRPLILNVLKPCTGFGPEEGAAWFEESARGGSDIVKDDELLSNPSFNQLEQRVRLYRQAAERVYEESGHRTLYCANVTDRADRVFTNARRAVELGADMIMLNSITAGLGTLQALAAMPEINVPILSHFAGFMSLTEGRRSGLSSPLLLGKLTRLAGADAVSYPSPYSGYPLLQENFLQIAKNLSMPLYDIKPALPNPGGGIHPSSAARILRDLGPDIMLTAGGSIQGHPNGAKAGVRALIAALEAGLEGLPLSEKARQSPELKAALERWGE